MIRAALFDLDGTLLDSMPMWRHLGERFLMERGITPRPGLGEALSELDYDEAAAYLLQEYVLPLSPEECRREIMELVRLSYRHKIPLKPGAAQLVKALHSRGLRLGVVTASLPELAGAALERVGLREYFSAVVTCEEYGIYKDNPEIFLLAARQLGALPAETLVVEDALYAARTAKQAGFVVWGIFDEASRPQQEEMRRLCDRYAMDFRELPADALP